MASPDTAEAVIWAAVCCRSSLPSRVSSSFMRTTAFWADMPP